MPDGGRHVTSDPLSNDDNFFDSTKSVSSQSWTGIPAQSALALVILFPRKSRI